MALPYEQAPGKQKGRSVEEFYELYIPTVLTIPLQAPVFKGKETQPKHGYH